MREKYVPAHPHGTPSRAERSDAARGALRAAAGVDALAGDDARPMAKTRSFVRRGGRLPANHQRAWDAHAEAFVLDVPRLGVSTSVDPGFVLDAQSAYGRLAPLVVEIGSGSGDAVTAAAQAHPENDYLAFEVYHPGVAQTLAKLGHHGLTNVRLVEVDAAEALATMLPEGAASEVWTFFPDPWPKAKHHKRRLVSEEFAATVARILRPGGLWRLATDWEDYAHQMLRVADASGELFDNTHRAHPGSEPAFTSSDGVVGVGDGIGPRFEGRALTRFENRAAREGRFVCDFTLVRR